MNYYNDVLKYIIENLSDYREEIESTLNYIYKYKMPFQRADRGGKLESAIMSAISDYEVDNDYEKDEVLDQLLGEYDLEDIFFDAIDKMDNRNNESINEANDFYYYTDEDGNRRMKFIDEDTGEELDMILDDDTINDINSGSAENTSNIETYFDDYDNTYYDNIHELRAQQDDLYDDLKYLKIERKELMNDMENDPEVINDINGEASQEYGIKLGEIDSKIEEIENEIKKIQKEMKELEQGINESYETHDWKHFDNDDRRYDAYVLIDESDGAIIYNYQVWPGDFWKDILDDAIEDAREEQRHNKYGSYGVYGCINNEYDESTRVFITNGLNESKHNKKSNKINELYSNKFKRNVYDDTKDPDKYASQPLKNNVDLYDVRQRVEQIIRNCNATDYSVAKKQALRLYKFIDAMINQGFYIK